MKIGIDISMLVYQGSGVATYTDDLVRALLQYAPKHEYHLFYSSLRRPPGFTALEEYRMLGATVHSFRYPPRVLKWLWNRYQLLPVEWLIGKVDYYLSSDYLRPPLLKGTKGLTTIHDLTWKLFPQYHTRDIIEAHSRKIEHTLRGGDIILLDSKNTKNDLLAHYPGISNSLYVIPLGIDLKHFRPFKSKSKKPYLLYVGAIEPRKNLTRLIEAFILLRQDPQYQDYRLVLAGRAGWKNSEVTATVERLDLTGYVDFPGYITSQDLPRLYSGASLLLYLSHYEGFGLPPLEAMACGTRVLTSSNSSLVETIPTKYRMQDIDNPKEIVKNIKRVLKLPPPPRSVVTKFSWQNYVKELLSLLS